ncbi:MAG TPA: AarF/ABC1/UbiB kinase family protein [Chloroflexota bacterium]|nr:AarF/ABC1/UbiB kinase family protein [Chloroflexota bacterium]
MPRRPAPRVPHPHRLRQIAGVLARHGFGSLLDALGLHRLVPVRHARRLVPGDLHPPDHHTTPERLRLALAELGITFIKLGQILSARPDVLGPQYAAELAKLQDHAPAVPVDAIREVIAAELGRPPEEVFASFDPVPLAAASIGQAHAATLPDGSRVVVKVRRPGAVEQVEQDLGILQALAATAARRWEPARDFDLVGLAQQFADTLRAELDYAREAHNVERFAADFRDDPTVHIPRVHWHATTNRVLTLERIEGIKISDRVAIDAAGIDRPTLARRAVRVQLRMLFENGFFHADPHAGNVFVEPAGRLALVDFGMVGTVDERTRQQLTDVLLAVSAEDPDDLADALLSVGITRGHVDRAALARDLQAVQAHYYRRPLHEIRIGPLVGEALGVAHRHRLVLPPHLALLLKTMVMSEGLGALLDPEFRLATAVAPYARRLLARRYQPRFVAREAQRFGLDAARLGAGLPRRVHRLLADVERGAIEVGVQLRGLDPVLRRLERLVNRLVLGILAAAFVNGLAVLLASTRAAGWELWNERFLSAGLLFVSLLGLYLTWTILRTGRA